MKRECMATQNRRTRRETMALPYLCTSCHQTYDGGHVTVVGRYADCDMWRAPCCGVQHDSRRRWNGPGWAHMGYDDLNAYRRIEGEPYKKLSWLP